MENHTIGTYSTCTSPLMQQTPNHKQGSGSSAFQFARAPYGSYSIVARNSNKADPAFQLQSQQTLDNQHCIQYHHTKVSRSPMLITFITKRPTSPETRKKNQCHETRELPSTPHYLINQMQQWWRSATTLYDTLYKIARFFSFLYKNSPPPI